MTAKFISLVRPFITVFAVFGLTIGFFTDRVTSEAYVPLMAMAITYWYTARENAKQNGGAIPPEPASHAPNVVDMRGK